MLMQMGEAVMPRREWGRVFVLCLFGWLSSQRSDSLLSDRILCDTSRGASFVASTSSPVLRIMERITAQFGWYHSLGFLVVHIHALAASAGDSDPKWLKGCLTEFELLAEAPSMLARQGMDGLIDRVAGQVQRLSQQMVLSVLTLEALHRLESVLEYLSLCPITTHRVGA